MITIIMATYNGQEYIKEQLSSIKNQSYKEWKLIVRDDGSKDQTVNMLEEFSKEVEQEVVIKINNHPTGCAKKNFALLLKDVKDEPYVMFADQDDIWKKDKLEVTYAAMKRAENKSGEKKPILVHGDVELIDENGELIADSMFRLSHIDKNSGVSQLIIQNHVTGCTMMCNHSLVKNIADFLSDDKVIMHDYFAALYASVFGKIIVIDRPLLSYRQHGNNSVGAKNNNNVFYLLKRLGEGRIKYKDSMAESQSQIEYFIDLYKTEMFKKNMENIYELMREYSHLRSKNKICRIMFYIKNRVWKTGIVRKVMQIIWG